MPGPAGARVWGSVLPTFHSPASKPTLPSLTRALSLPGAAYRPLAGPLRYQKEPIPATNPASIEQPNTHRPGPSVTDPRATTPFPCIYKSCEARFSSTAPTSGRPRSQTESPSKLSVPMLGLTLLLCPMSPILDPRALPGSSLTPRPNLCHACFSGPLTPNPEPNPLSQGQDPVWPILGQQPFPSDGPRPSIQQPASPRTRRAPGRRRSPGDVNSARSDLP